MDSEESPALRGLSSFPLPVDQPTCPHYLGVPLSSKTRDICRVNPNHAEVYTAKVKSLKVNEPTALNSLTPGSPSSPEASSVYRLS